MKLALSLVLAVALLTNAFGQDVRKINTCFEEALAALRLSQLEDGIAQCDQVIEDKANPADRRGQAYAQRGLMEARRWSILSTPAFAVKGIADLTESFLLHTPPQARKHHLLLIRGQLNAATGQTRRAFNDFTAVLREDPTNNTAQNGLKQVGSPAGL